jgi:Protein of unknown function (DUF3443)
VGHFLRHVLCWCGLALLAACGGGGDSSVTTLRCGTTDCAQFDPAVATAFVQTANNLRVAVDDQGPHGGFGSGTGAVSTNLLFATVKVCVPGDANLCTSIDHVLVDTGSVGLRVLASKVQQLSLPPIKLSADTDPVQRDAWECFPFVIGGLWGANVAADVWLGQQKTEAAVSMQLIDDQNRRAPTSDCVTVTDNGLLASAAALGANGILGIGSTILDCGLYCEQGLYHVRASDPMGSSTLYYSCPSVVTTANPCALAAMPVPLQSFNPVAKMAAPYNNGVVLKMPAIPDTQIGAVTAAGELILGVDANNLPMGAERVFLGVADASTDSFLNIHTEFNNHLFAASYLDTGTNGLFFYDASMEACSSRTESYYWYCPPSTRKNLQAVLSDGDNAALHRVPVNFQIANALVLFGTSNTASSSLGGAVNSLDPNAQLWVPNLTTFAWGMPFFYGKQVYLSIWQQAGSENGPWYAWAPL